MVKYYDFRGGFKVYEIKNRKRNELILLWFTHI